MGMLLARAIRQQILSSAVPWWRSLFYEYPQAASLFGCPSADFDEAVNEHLHGEPFPAIGRGHNVTATGAVELALLGRDAVGRAPTWEPGHMDEAVQDWNNGGGAPVGRRAGASDEQVLGLYGSPTDEGAHRRRPSMGAMIENGEVLVVQEPANRNVSHFQEWPAQEATAITQLLNGAEDWDKGWSNHGSQRHQTILLRIKPILSTQPANATAFFAQWQPQHPEQEE
ncbi:uncharacterized protein EV422DRAFT_572444 [Fimicolochytrium jonesii]|uniref:uncharacterized protein n=1 Tax=Fimicolochytrium jonesii TaxID=1396493 RepID=UPI0022FE2261|nr:uncharacterized protein EV422DRAFT_572444 [Fimicolochytrium jonesii]KAI8815742.1 hypothetical protein EV422DRAFT_572444 [Fimicolochytrium jonesii]